MGFGLSSSRGATHAIRFAMRGSDGRAPTPPAASRAIAGAHSLGNGPAQPFATQLRANFTVGGAQYTSIPATDRTSFPLPLERMGSRAAALVPPPRHPLVRFYGVWAPHHRWRNRIVRATPKTKRSGCSDPSGPSTAPSGTDGDAIAAGETRPSTASFATEPRFGPRARATNGPVLGASSASPSQTVTGAV
jgi:hypothetical protein